MNRKIITALELTAIIGLMLYVLWIGGVFRPPPVPTPTPTAFVTSTPAPAASATLPPTPVGTVPPLTQASGVIAFTSNRDGNAEIYRMEADGSNQQNLTRNPGQDTLIGWSPDGRRLAFFSTRTNGWLEIFVMDADGANVLQLTRSFGTDTAYASGVAWSPDGKYLLATRSSPWAVQQYLAGTTLDLIATDAGQVKELYSNPSFAWQATFSPDGQFIVMILQTDSGTGLYRSLVSDSLNFKLANSSCGYGYIWHPGQNRLTCSTGTSFFDLDPDGSNPQVVLANANSIDYANLAAWAPDNSKLLTNFINWLGANDPSSEALTLIDPTEGTQTVIYRDKDMSVNNTFAWAPDSQWVVLASEKSGSMDIYALNVYAAQGAVPMQPLQLTGESGDNYLPQWQPAPLP